jgi:hypothetical protein
MEKGCSYRTLAYSAWASLKMGMSESASRRLGAEDDSKGFDKYLLLPAKHLRRERGAHDKRHRQCGHVAPVRPPRVTLPNPFEQ